MSDTPASDTPTHSAAGAAVCPACGQRVRSDDDRKRNRFFWGLALAWLPFIPVLVGLVNALRGMSQQKATGIGAVAGGIAEMGVLYVLALARFSPFRRGSCCFAVCRKRIRCGTYWR